MSHVSGSHWSEANSQFYTMREAQWLYCGAFNKKETQIAAKWVAHCKMCCEKQIGMSRYLLARSFLSNWLDWTLANDSIQHLNHNEQQQSWDWEGNTRARLPLHSMSWQPNWRLTSWPHATADSQGQAAQEDKTVVVRFEFLSATFFHRQELFEKLRRIFVFVRWPSVKLESRN